MAVAPVIICFGDSLTAGYQLGDAGVTETPYGAFLQERLGRRASVLVRGVCGEVTSEMVARFDVDVLAARPMWVWILGGTNDLGLNADPQTIMQNLVNLYGQAAAVGIRVGAITVPSIRLAAETAEERAFIDDHLRRRDVLNGLIQRRCGAHGIPCVDLFTATAEPGTRQLAAEYSNDGLHLSTAGYRRLADLVHDALTLG